MAEPKRPKMAKFFFGLIGSDLEAIGVTCKKLRDKYGELEVESDVFPFDFTDYYEDEMGKELKRKFIGIKELIDPGNIADIKLETNSLEDEIAEKLQRDVSRPINIDPGYIEPSKMVLASTKNYSHRIYIKEGIYAEVTLQYKNGKFRPQPWTYPDYRTDAYLNFFERLRDKYMPQLEKGDR